MVLPGYELEQFCAQFCKTRVYGAPTQDDDNIQPAPQRLPNGAQQLAQLAAQAVAGHGVSYSLGGYEPKERMRRCPIWQGGCR